MPVAIEERFALALHTTARRWRNRLDRRLKFLGLSQAGWMTITSVAKIGKPMSQTELATAVGVEGATMVTMLDRLVRDGLVERQPSPTDRRIKLISLTEAGKAIFGKVCTEADLYRDELLAGCDAVALEQATTILERIGTTIEESR